MALEAAHGLHPCLALGLLFGEELAGRGIAAALGDGDAVKGAVELTVAAAIEAVADASARGGGDRGDAGQAGELGIAVKAPRAGGLGEELGCGQGAATLQGEQLRSLGFDEDKLESLICLKRTRSQSSRRHLGPADVRQQAEVFGELIASCSALA